VRFTPCHYERSENYAKSVALIGRRIRTKPDAEFHQQLFFDYCGQVHIWELLTASLVPIVCLTQGVAIFLFSGRSSGFGNAPLGQIARLGQGS
jgi:hypothetical protein